MTRFGQRDAMEEFQLDGGATVRIPMMHQDNYPMKMGIDSDLDCTVTDPTAPNLSPGWVNAPPQRVPYL